MKVDNLVASLFKVYPKALALDFDNVGLLVGDPSCEVKKVYVTLDIDLAVLSAAVEQGCNVVLSHHPILAFDNLKAVVKGDYTSEVIAFAINHDLNIISMHTNVDYSAGIMSKWIADDLNLAVRKYQSFSDGIGAIFNVPKQSLQALLDVMAVPCKYNGDLNKVVSKVAIIGGSGKDYLKEFYSEDIDVFISGDLSYHVFHENSKTNRVVIDIGHPAEQVFCKHVLAHAKINVDYVTSDIECCVKSYK